MNLDRWFTTAEHGAFRVFRYRAVHAAPYLATAVFNLRPVRTPGLGTFAVDDRWRLYLDPAKFDDWGVDQCAGALIHEVNHVLRRHRDRWERHCGGRDHERWNVAADAEINDDVTGLPLPTGAVMPSTIGAPDGQLAETYYNHLRCPSAAGGKVRACRQADCGSGVGGDRAAYELARDDLNIPGLDRAAGELVRRQTAQDIMSYHDGRRSRSTPNGLLVWAAGEFTPPTVNWRRLLGASVRSAVAHRTGQVDFTYGRPGRRRVARIVTPAMTRPVPHLAVVVDTSGSMSPADLDVAMNEVVGIARRLGVRGTQLKVLAVDASTHSVTPLRDPHRLRMAGGGGTDMRVGVAAAENLHPHPDCVVVLTDGLTPWPQLPGRSLVVAGIVGADPAAVDAVPAHITAVAIPTGDGRDDVH